MSRADRGRGSAYGSAGVDYDVLDAGKRSALTEALATSGLLGLSGGRAIDASRGEPAFVFEVAGQTLAFVLETLGTKSMIARQLEPTLGAGSYDAVAYDTVAAVVNDLCCVGALPLVVNAYFATGSSDWYGDGPRNAALLAGWRRGCEDAGATWGGGESPALAGLVAADEIELAGSAVGIVPPGRSPILGAELAPGDAIVIVESSGLHANGASLARLIAARIPESYGTRLPSGRTFGEAILDPSVIYAPLIRALLATEINVHYLSHITGHGLLKLMRPRRDLGYELSVLPPVPEVLTFLAQHAELSPAAAYSTLNMGCGFAVYCAESDAGAVVDAAVGLGFAASVAGIVTAGPRRVALPQIGVTFTGDELDLTPRV